MAIDENGQLESNLTPARVDRIEKVLVMLGQKLDEFEHDLAVGYRWKESIEKILFLSGQKDRNKNIKEEK